MEEDILVYQYECQIDDQNYCIQIFSKSDGQHYAKTVLNFDDIIINDGDTLTDVLTKHENLLPLAISTRKMRNSIRSDSQ